MNKSLSYVNLSLELHVVLTFWLGSDTSGTFSLHLFCPAIISTWETSLLENAHTLAQRTGIFSCKYSAKVSLMLEDQFLVPSLCKLNHIRLCFIQISTKSPAKLLIPFRESTAFFEAIPGVLGRSVNFNITKIFIKTPCASRLSVSCDYDFWLQQSLQENKNTCSKSTIKTLENCLKLTKKTPAWR